MSGRIPLTLWHRRCSNHFSWSTGSPSSWVVLLYCCTRQSRRFSLVSVDFSHDASVGQSLIEVGFLGAAERPMGVGTMTLCPSSRWFSVGVVTLPWFRKVWRCGTVGVVLLGRVERRTSLLPCFHKMKLHVLM
jgi:hypothetical protein